MAKNLILAISFGFKLNSNLNLSLVQAKCIKNVDFDESGSMFFEICYI